MLGIRFGKHENSASMWIKTLSKIFFFTYNTSLTYLIKFDASADVRYISVIMLLVMARKFRKT